MATTNRFWTLVGCASAILFLVQEYMASKLADPNLPHFDYTSAIWIKLIVQAVVVASLSSFLASRIKMTKFAAIIPLLLFTWVFATIFVIGLAAVNGGRINVVGIVRGQVPWLIAAAIGFVVGLAIDAIPRRQHVAKPLYRD